MPSDEDVNERVRPRVLLVEDDADLRLATRLALTGAGWVVVEAATGVDAIVLAGREDPDVIVLDLGLPDCDGREVLCRLKSRDDTASIPVVVLSARTDGTAVSDLLRSGAQDFILKPFSPDELEARLIAARRVAVERRRLNVSEAKYRQLVDLAAEGLFALDADGTVTFVNAAMSAMLGRKERDIVGQKVAAFMDDEAQTVLSAQLADRPRHSGSYDNMFRDHSGRPVWVQVAATPIFGSDGAFEGSVGLATDMRARRAAEQSLRDSEARYRGLIECLPDTAVSVWDPTLRLTWLDERAIERRDVPFAVSAGNLLSDVTVPEEFTILQGPYLKAAAGERTTLEYTSPRTGRNLLIDLVPVRDDAGHVVEVVSISRDVTDLREGERALVRAGERYRTAFDAAPVGMAEVDFDGRFIKVNQALSAMLGYRSDDLEGARLVDIIHPDGLAAASGGLRAMVTGQVDRLRAENRFIHADGHPVWAEVSVAAVTDGAGKVSHFIAHYLDINERKHFERQLQHLADHDPLTGLLNRRGFEVELDRQAARVTRYGPSGALLVLDLDHLKQINDTLGHNAGDEMIVSMANVLRGAVRETDVVARLGGDEFAVILPHAGSAEAELVAGKLVDAVRDRVTMLSGAQYRQVTTSIGVALFDDPELTGEDVLVNADLTMYDAKEAGRDRYATYRTETHGQSRIKSPPG